MNYRQVIEYLDLRLNFEQQGMPNNADLRLDRMAALLRSMGSPQKSFAVVHIAGTKGKGSTAALVASALGACGKRVGLHTSPHLDCVQERMSVDGRIPSEEEFAALLESCKSQIEAVDAALEKQPKLTYFEITTALSLEHFRRQGVDVGVIEVGMGGRLDATNVVTPEVSVITSISKDHTKQLGDRLESIAAEKAGIIKRGRPTVSGVLDDAPRAVIEQIAGAMESPLFQLQRDFHYETRQENSLRRIAVETWRRRWPEFSLKIPGEHQAQNAAVAAAALEILDERQAVDVRPEAVARAWEGLTIPGRFENVLDNPYVVVDVAHNEASAQALAGTLSSTIAGDRFGKRTLIFGASRDKQWTRMLEILAPIFDHVVLTCAQDNPRALTVDELRVGVEKIRGTFRITSSPTEAWKLARESFDPSIEGMVSQRPGFVCITGSFYLVAQLRRLLRNEAKLNCQAAL